MLNLDQILQQLESLSFREAERRLGVFDSFDRTIALIFVLQRAPSAADQLKTFLEWWNVCDAPWRVRAPLSNILKDACAQAQMADLLTPDARSFFRGLPALVPVWRGCEMGGKRGTSWTTDRKVARRFAIGQRHTNTTPTLVSAKIPKQHIFGVFVDRNEKEIVLNPRLRFSAVGAQAALRDLHPQVHRGRPRHGVQLAGCPARGLRGLYSQSARGGMASGPGPLRRRWRLRRHAGAPCPQASIGGRRGRQDRPGHGLQDRPALAIDAGLSQPGREIRAPQRRLRFEHPVV